MSLWPAVGASDLAYLLWGRRTHKVTGSPRDLQVGRRVEALAGAHAVGRRLEPPVVLAGFLRGS
jgi:hypothetical protein